MAKKLKRYEETNVQQVNEPEAMYLVNKVRKGITYAAFMTIATQSTFSITEWAQYLHLSERTMQRYKKEQKPFDDIYAEKIMQISMLYDEGLMTFGNKQKFDTWLNSNNIALGGVAPKTFLDNTFGINLLHDELNRISHGVLA